MCVCKYVCMYVRMEWYRCVLCGYVSMCIYAYTVLVCVAQEYGKAATQPPPVVVGSTTGGGAQATPRALHLVCRALLMWRCPINSKAKFTNCSGRETWELSNGRTRGNGDVCGSGRGLGEGNVTENYKMQCQLFRQALWVNLNLDPTGT